MQKLEDIAEICLLQTDVSEKIRLTQSAKKWADAGQLCLAYTRKPKVISATQFPENPLLLAPREMPNRQFNSPAGLAAFFHALAHIEFIAVYLAWDILYRFRGLPEQFYIDWLTIAAEEALHFQLLNAHLSQFNVSYGDLPAHHGLWEHAVDTADDILARLALVPRCMEARGLDVTPAMIAKFQARGDEASVNILQRILTDEIGHVACGSYWFHWLCQQQQLDTDQHFQKLIKQYYKGGKPKGPFNRELRIMAGFSEADLTWLEQA